MQRSFGFEGRSPKAKSTKLPENLKIADIFQGEVNIPDNFHLFLITSSVDQTRESNHLQINRDRQIQLGRASFMLFPVEQRFLQNIYKLV